jgi:hypothetical protein
VRTIAAVFKCTFFRDSSAFTFGLEVSDQGQLAKASHGAIRKNNYVAVPERLASDAFHRFHHNPEGLVQRDAISCRLDHPTSTTGHWTHGFSTRDGNPISRTGWHVPCIKDADCFRKCPRHPLTGSFYRCQKLHKYFDVGITDDDGGIEFVNLTAGSSNAFDVEAGRGICVDTDSAMFQGCPEPVMAKVVDGIIGCADRFVSQFLCGLELRVKHGDSSTASVEGNFIYPRTLIAGGEDLDGDGKQPSSFKCEDPVVSHTSTRAPAQPHRNPVCLHRRIVYKSAATWRARALAARGRRPRVRCAVRCHSLASHEPVPHTPPARADQYCSSNIVNTITSLIDAVFADMLTAVRLVSVCLGDYGIGGCICQLAVRQCPFHPLTLEQQ